MSIYHQYAHILEQNYVDLSSICTHIGTELCRSIINMHWCSNQGEEQSVEKKTLKIQSDDEKSLKSIQKTYLPIFLWNGKKSRKSENYLKVLQPEQCRIWSIRIVVVVVVVVFIWVLLYSAYPLSALHLHSGYATWIDLNWIDTRVTTAQFWHRSVISSFHSIRLQFSNQFFFIRILLFFLPAFYHLST
jgi:hypothetical protein